MRWSFAPNRWTHDRVTVFFLKNVCSRTNINSNCAGVLFQHLFHKVFVTDEAWRETETGVYVISRYSLFIFILFL